MSNERSEPPILAVHELVKDYGPVHAVRGISFDVPRNCCFGLLGPNGAGKTTTVEIIEGVTPATSGEVLYEGRKAAAAFRQDSGVQFQTAALQDFITVRETLEMFHRLYRRRADIDEVIADCALEKLQKRDNRKLSGGQRQRLLLAIALVNDPKILFLDEPTTGMDPQARRNFWELVERIRARNKTIVLTTHYMEEAQALCDEIVIMNEGVIVTQGAPDTLLKAHYKEIILELPESDLEELPPEFPFHTYRRNGLVEIHTDDANEAITRLSRAGAPLGRLNIRPFRLEDLFLDLTGKELRS